MTWLRLLIASLLAASLAACYSDTPKRHASTPSESLGAIIGTVERLIDADNEADLPKVLGCYTDDVTWLPPGEAPVHGKDAIRARYESLFATFRLEFTLEIAEASADGNSGFAWGYTRGRITPLAGGEPIAVDDRFLAVLRCEQDGWRVARLAWSPSQHAP